uniref:Transmembrane protein n=2 Tax=Ditylum brightwellii TaxID=49249 RepID=A0A7S4RTW4_9STRA|mmetsp:Transcript_5847/g.7589  ORF Transcript_5847/g.7589 Transcript_5847/m.7589 type:complete len:397 (+) Transcript_5847:199-1389(+)
MTFIDPSAEPPTTGMITGYIILVIAFLFCFLKAVRLGQTRSHYRSFFAIRFLLPLCCFILAVETATLAASGIYSENKSLDDNVWIQIVYVIQAFEVPILLQSTFETCYLVHKRRSVNFCGMYFDEGRRVNRGIATTPMKSFILRNFIRAIAVLLLVMGLVVNFDLLRNVVEVDRLAGRAGWWPLFERKNNAEGQQLDFSENTHLFLSLLPTAILILCSFYFSALLWRYGTESSMVVHSSCWNPWFSLFFGTIFLFIGECFSEKWYPISSNTGFVLFIISYLHLMTEVDKDMKAASEFVEFLSQVKDTGDAFSVRRQPQHYNSTNNNNRSNVGAGGTTSTNNTHDADEDIDDDDDAQEDALEAGKLIQPKNIGTSLEIEMGNRRRKSFTGSGVVGKT